MENIDISHFDYHLPLEQIAQHPLDHRDSSRLMQIDRRNGSIGHHRFSQLADLLSPSDVLIFNNSKVIPARLLGHRLGLSSESSRHRPSARIEVLLVRRLDPLVWEVLVKPGRKIRIGERIEFGEGRLVGEVLERGAYGLRTVRFTCAEDFDHVLDELGHVPLPPYIQRPDQPADRSNYQTIFAKVRGSVAAPTAGLHFTQGVLDRLRAKGVACHELTLHVGLGTFQPVRSQDPSEHRMLPERYEISRATAQAINQARQRGKRILAVGTTTTRALEAAIRVGHGEVLAGSGETDLFIFPPFEFACVGGILTNFHLPRTTLLMLVCAFGSTDLVLRAYRKAVERGYRFYSYGDCMLLL
ncbi:MAG: tRNA preQ1(34) S-adenosylmethionine ribosyltransferase-isomerase QueA [Acidobacteriota bacterium]